jgi:quinol-cytochrome oxidoreductase complex cytochrome b subunit
MEKKVTSPVIKGLLIALLLIIIGFVGRMTNLQYESWFAWLSYGLLIGGVIFSCITYSNQMDHNVTFGNVFANGFKTTAVVTCLTILFMVILLMVMPEIKEEMMENARTQAAKGPGTEEQIDQSMQIFNRMFWVFVIGGILVAYLILGCIASLIGAAVAKKNPQPTNPF